MTLPSRSTGERRARASVTVLDERRTAALLYPRSARRVLAVPGSWSARAAVMGAGVLPSPVPDSAGREGRS